MVQDLIKNLSSNVLDISNKIDSQIHFQAVELEKVIKTIKTPRIKENVKIKVQVTLTEVC